MNNPELRRYAWLELGRHRLVAVPLILGALVTMLAALADRAATALTSTGFGLFAVVTVGWGTLRAFASVTDEVRDRTWDFQRMAAIHPRDMALGKMLGAPLLTWYVGFWSLVMFVVGGWVTAREHLVALLVLLVALALLLHAVGVALSALTARVTGAGPGRRWSGIVLLVVLLYLVPTLVAWSTSSDASPALAWWFLRDLAPETFAAVTVVLFAGWAFFGAWRAMALELREPPWWWAWPAFAAFTGFWWAGVGSGTETAAPVSSVFALPAFVLVYAAYQGLLIAPMTPVRIARWQRTAAEPGTPWQERVPHWLLHGCIALGLALLAVVLAEAGGTQRSEKISTAADFSALAVAAALMFLRDAAVVTCFTLQSRLRRPLGLAAFYIAVADLLLPALFGALGARPIASAVFPFWGLGSGRYAPAAGFAVHLVLAVAVLAWLARRNGVQSPWNPPAR